MNQHSYNTVLSDRILWYDGDSSYDPDDIISSIKQEHKCSWANSITPDIQRYNQLVDVDKQIKIKQTCNNLDVNWNVPDTYKNLDIISFIIDKHDKLFANITPQERKTREIRVAEELILYKKYNLYTVLRTIIYIINTLISNDVVWGVGRGSAVSSYILYIIGVHFVDSYKYELNISDFLHD